MSSGYIVGVSGGFSFSEPALPWLSENDHIVTFRPGERPAFNEEHPIDIKVSYNWKDDFDNKVDADYHVMVEVYRPTKDGDRMLWKCQIQRSRLAKKPELVRLEVQPAEDTF